ncbi:MAG: hypothetical protein AAF399_30150, partial [Bacteroidota bacterium]
GDHVGHQPLIAGQIFPHRDDAGLDVGKMKASRFHPGETVEKRMTRKCVFLVGSLLDVNVRSSVKNFLKKKKPPTRSPVGGCSYG